MINAGGLPRKNSRETFTHDALLALGKLGVETIHVYAFKFFTSLRKMLNVKLRDLTLMCLLVWAET